MQFSLLLIFTFSYIYFTYAAELKSPMTNNYPQIAVLGCDTNKANLYFDVQRQVWVEHLVSSCVTNEQSILEFCQQAYPSLNIGNIIRLETVLRFENWCELLAPSDDNKIPRCKSDSQSEEVVQPFRCLHKNSQREEISFPTIDCTINRINNTGECLRAEKWQQYASLDCSKKAMLLNSSIMPVDWCGLSEFRGIEYICCPSRDIDTRNDYETSLDEKDDNALSEDDPVQDFVIVPKTSTAAPHRKIIAMSLSSRKRKSKSFFVLLNFSFLKDEPNWMDDYRRWNSDAGYFADDEDTNDDQEEIKLSSARKSHLTINEHERFTKEKEAFKRKYKEQINDLKSRWQKNQDDIKILAKKNSTEAQRQYENIEIEFRQEYDLIKQTASRERTRINALHESNLDNALDIAKKETSQKLNVVWNEKPLKAKNIEEALYNYLHVLLRDRIHLVNRYERLRTVDPEQAKRKRISIHERLRLIANQLNEALNQLRNNPTIQSEIQSRIDILLREYDEVSQAADRLVSDYEASLPKTTTTKIRMLPLGRDEKKIYRFSTTASNKINTKDDDNTNNEYNYDTDDDYDDDDDNDESTTKATKTNNNINDQVNVGESDWDIDIDSDASFNVKIASNNDDQIYNDIHPLIPNKEVNNRFVQRHLFLTYLPYIIGSLLIVCIIFGFIIFRLIIQQRRKYQYGKYEKNYTFTEVESSTPEEKALHALQMNGYENPTYRFFESQSPKC
ncbi:unnamed protein product [Adineta steineri]|uniref:Uncharacterized protein n=1 Tax=Adineta steineri TaxID=433720 RepID=A0A814DEX0_9BILA|nr:unnamed protein product [Adineta steineri]